MVGRACPCRLDRYAAQVGDTSGAGRPGRSERSLRSLRRRALYTQTLKGDEIKAAFSGKSGTWQGNTGNGGSIRYEADGKARVHREIPRVH